MYQFLLILSPLPGFGAIKINKASSPDLSEFAARHWYAHGAGSVSPPRSLPASVFSGNELKQSEWSNDSGELGTRGGSKRLMWKFTRWEEADPPHCQHQHSPVSERLGAQSPSRPRAGQENQGPSQADAVALFEDGQCLARCW